jgi:hypothetical protein
MMSSETAPGFDDWRRLLADTVDVAREIGCQPCVAVALSTQVDTEAVDSRDTLDFFGVFPDGEFAPLLALNAAARDTVRRLAFPDAMHRQLHERELLQLAFPDAMHRQLHERELLQNARRENRRVRGDIQPDFEFYDPAGLAAWAALLLPALEARLDQALAAAGAPPA